MKSQIFWVARLYTSEEIDGCFEGKYDLHLQGQRISRARYQ
jgi:hypothetical protein